MQLKPLPIQFDVVKIVVQVGTGMGYPAFVLKNKLQNLTGYGVQEGVCIVRDKAWLVVNVYITMPHIKNDISMQLKPLPIQFDVVKIVVQVATGSG